MARDENQQPVPARKKLFKRRRWQEQAAVVNQPVTDVKDTVEIEVSPASVDIGPVKQIEGIVRSVETSPFSDPGTTFYDAEKFRDQVRSKVAFMLLYIFAGTIALTFLVLFFNIFLKDSSTWTNVKDWIEAILPAETGLLGSAVGFYFGTQVGKRGKREG
jgi:hypothetical protein